MAIEMRVHILCLLFFWSLFNGIGIGYYVISTLIFDNRPNRPKTKTHRTPFGHITNFRFFFPSEKTRCRSERAGNWKKKSTNFSSGIAFQPYIVNVLSISDFYYCSRYQPTEPMFTMRFLCCMYTMELLPMNCRTKILCNSSLRFLCRRINFLVAAKFEWEI